MALASTVHSSSARQVAAMPKIDPALLDELHGITCVGESYDLDLPVQKDWNPNTVSVQKLCAKPRYGGGLPGQTLGGWCNRNEVVFDHVDNVEVNPQLSNPRVQLGCRYRCFCNSNIPQGQRSTQPKPNEYQTTLNVLSRKSSETYEIQLDIVDDFTTPLELKKGHQGARIVPALRKTHVRESEQYEDIFRPQYQYVSQDPGNSIRCQGPLPTFILPDPYSVSDFDYLQQLCALQLDGGLLGANAGGYCYRSDAIPNGGWTVWFSDEMTPRLDWTWSGGSFFAAASIRMHCMKYCRCTNSSDSSAANTTYLNGFWNFVGSAQLALWPSGQIDLQSNGNAAPVTVLPSQSGPGSPSGSCGVNGKQFCPQPWPTSRLGPIPRAPPNATDIVRPGPNPGTNMDPTVCGNQCQGPQDCGGGDEEKACACAIPTARDAKALGLDPVFPVAKCLVLMHSNFGGKGDLIGRREENPWRCLCNATFAHGRCCASRNGMIWLS